MFSLSSLFENLTLDSPRWLLLLPLPLLVHYLLPAYQVRRSAVRVPFFQQLIKLTGTDPADGAIRLRATRVQKALLLIQWLMVVLAMSQPIWLGEPVTRERTGRDLMVAVDLSGSMAEQDFIDQQGRAIDRLEAAKGMLREFVTQRSGDRLGLILFGDAAYLQTPFTGDHQTWLQLLQETEIGMAGERTKFGDAIGLAIKRFKNGDSEHRVLLMLTDGNDTHSMVPPVEAAKIAAMHDIRIYLIAMGDPANIRGGLDLETLQQVADITNGELYQALSREELLSAYQAIDAMEPEVYERTSHRPTTSLHHYPITLSALLYLLFLSWMMLRAAVSRRKQRLLKPMTSATQGDRQP